MQQHLRTLKRLGQPTDSWGTILIHLFIPKLDSITRREWESERADKSELPSMEDFTKFLETRCSFLDALSRTGTLSISKAAQGQSKQQSTKSANQIQAHISTENSACPICQNTHKIYECLIFRNMSIQARIEKVKSCKLCYNCLKQFHGKGCTYGSCKKCQKRHNTLLHIDGTAASNAPSSGKDNTKQDALASSAEEPKNTNASNNNVSNVSNSLSSCHTNGSLSHILLSTAIIYVCDQAGNLHECRALLDSGSQANFLSQELCERLKLPRRSADTIISGISMTSSTAERQTTTTIHSRFNKFQAKLSFLIVNKITNNLPATNVDVDSLQIPSNIKLADPTFHMPGRIDLLLGAEIFWRFPHSKT
ncbi:PREDICTED: uncharacterized protein LOC105556338, partial [Vollenhovia emeryi]|uniref:uncharacterized protein LOC105556338 n=1 Tax=Vollenhovia emeryi TaxID=411798 RepID=UPI0005F4E061